jgi:T4-like virus tail tube protein gp19
VNKNSIVSLTLACAALAGVFYPASITSPITGKHSGDVAIAATNLQFYFETNPSTRFQIYTINGLPPKDALAAGRISSGQTTIQFYATPYQLFQWYRGVLGSSPKAFFLSVYDPNGSLQAKWQMQYTTPTKYEVASLKADGQELLLETITLMHEGIERVQ